MAEGMRTIALGDTAVTVINIGWFRARLDQWFPVPDEQWPARYAADLHRDLLLPIQCMYVAAGGLSVLVDAPVYAMGPDSPYFLPGYQPPSGLLAYLAELGVLPSSIDRVVISHAHFDHYNGTTVERASQSEPVFPRARHSLGRADWERQETRAALANPGSLESRTLAILERRGMLELVGPEGADLGHGIRIIAAPGESPGHQIVRVHAGGQSLYYLGDLIHHPIEIEQPSWMVPWADPAATRASREALLADAPSEDALLVATHIAAIGRLRREGQELRWETVDPGSP
jgi:glyoxylase-like metal-dependent hydrolase (beta-lactamase superfamily II)